MKRIEELLSKKEKLASEISQIKQAIEDILFDYHKKLIKCNFYKEFKINGNPLEQMFWIKDYDFPYSDHGEGDYIRIDFEIEEGNLNLDYSCSYQRECNGVLISIPLDVLEDEESILVDFILEEVIKKEEAVEKARLEQEKKNKADRIATLEKELKSLKK